MVILFIICVVMVLLTDHSGYRYGYGHNHYHRYRRCGGGGYRPARRVVFRG